MVDLASLRDSSGGRNILNSDRDRPNSKGMDILGQLLFQNKWGAVATRQQYVDGCCFVFMGPALRLLSVILHAR